ncbi:MAG: phosphoribosylanthranilate isomerase [Candidatus Kapabacteria bacterium]|jgi:phosphoribosylanthranilate isomerase|nr:phosphoribosylanthranilate isomerase [Candidatus Kapabacteria bacterium]
MKINLPFIQIAGVHSLEEAQMLADLGVKYIGFPLRLDFNKEDISEEKASRIISILPDNVKPILITYEDRADEIINMCDMLNCSNVQIHGVILIDQLRKLRKKRKDIFIIKSLVVGRSSNEILYRNMRRYEPLVDAFITDTYDLVSGASGATGKTHDLNISADIVKLSSLPVILAGGLNKDNVKEAIIKVRPGGVDSHTGVEGIDGFKNPEKIQSFLSEAASGFDAIK